MAGAGSLVPQGVIHAEIYSHGDPESAGAAWTGGERGFALGWWRTMRAGCISGQTACTVEPPPSRGWMRGACRLHGPRPCRAGHRIAEPWPDMLLPDPCMGLQT